MQEFILSKTSITIGRATVNDIVLSDTSVSRHHARMDRGPQGCEVIDLGSANGLRVNGAPAARAFLKAGDVFGIGDCSFRFERAGEERGADVTRIDTEADLKTSLMETPLSVQLEETSLPRLAVLTAARTWEVRMRGDCLTIGRQPENDVFIDSSNVSRYHAVLERKGELFTIRDLGSRGGTWMLKQRVSTKVVEDGDTIQIGRAQLVFKRGFAEDDLAGAEVRRGVKAKRRPVVIIPGFAGSTLWRGSEQIWPTRAALTHLDLISLDKPLEARGLVNEVVIVPNLIKQEQYSSLTDYLKEYLEYEAGKDLMEFGYDFRQDNRESARRLAAAVDAWQVPGPITIVAHSMGCLVARYYIERLGGKNKVERVIFLGGPHAGAPYAFTSLLVGPDLLPMGLFNARLRDLLATYPSWYQILPTYEFVSDQQSVFDVLTEESWVIEKHRPLLRRAREFRAQLGVGSSVPSVSVFGYGMKTITAATVTREVHGGCQKASIVVTPRGDGTIPEFSSVIAGAEIHPVHQHHGSLYGDSDVKMRLKLELTRPSS
jgi:pSer/pThr/pTyr-binding forkhead associated (FHA) protein